MMEMWKRLMQKKRRVVIITTIAAITLFGTVSFVDNDFKLIKSLDIYYTLFRELNMYYVDETDPEKLVKTSIDAMLETLDPYTVFVPESEMDNYKFMTTGQYGGIGAQVRKIEGNFVISEPYVGYPTHKAGIKAGDIIVEINNVPINKKLNDLGNLLTGEPNTEVTLTLQRPGESKTYKKTLIREKISMENVPYYSMVDATTGYIKLTNFTDGASIEVKNAIQSLKLQGANKLILDLRSNPGGFLGEAIDVTNLFIDKGQEVVQTRGKFKQWQKTYKCENLPVDTKIPLAVLVNQNSASAAEIVAGALQDLDRAVIIGQRTFGKGLVQATRPLSYNTQLKITTAKYYIPSGRCIQALDYSHRENNGDASHIPDSLIHEFKTKNKRKVFDGGGIQPDIKTETETLSRITFNLYARNFLFNYATLYTLQHDSIPGISEFALTDADYANFVKYLKDKDFTYVTETEDALNKLKKIAEKEKLDEVTKTEFDAISKKIAESKLKDLETYKAEILEMLKEEIASRYYYQKGRIGSSLPHDPDIKKAKELLKDEKTYSSILSGTGDRVAMK